MLLTEFEANHREILKVTAEAGETWAWDDVNDIELPMKDVLAARAEEMAHMKAKTFVVVKTKEAFEVTGKKPISTKWVDTDKSHGQGKMLVRSRLVARDFKMKGEWGREDLFCSSPPLELIRFLVSKAASFSNVVARGKRKSSS